MKVIKDGCYKGTRILIGNEKSNYINECRELLLENNFIEISMPIINFQEVFNEKVGEENNNMMYNFQDRGNRELCLAPEYTSIIQNLSKKVFRQQNDVKVFYVAECFRGEKPQRGRYRQFTQLGVEIINPFNSAFQLGRMEVLSCALVQLSGKKFIRREVKNRGLSYYTQNTGFEIDCNDLGASKQVCGGGAYDGGVGFAIGVDRLLDFK